MSTTFAAVQHAPQQISIDMLIDGKYSNQMTGYFSSREEAKQKLTEMCQLFGRPMQSRFVLSPSDVGLFTK